MEKSRRPPGGRGMPSSWAAPPAAGASPLAGNIAARSSPFLDAMDAPAPSRSERVAPLSKIAGEGPGRRRRGRRGRSALLSALGSNGLAHRRAHQQYFARSLHEAKNTISSVQGMRGWGSHRPAYLAEVSTFGKPRSFGASSSSFFVMV